MVRRGCAGDITSWGGPARLNRRVPARGDPGGWARILSRSVCRCTSA